MSFILIAIGGLVFVLIGEGVFGVVGWIFLGIILPLSWFFLARYCGNRPTNTQFSDKSWDEVYF